MYNDFCGRLERLAWSVLKRLPRKFTLEVPIRILHCMLHLWALVKAVQKTLPVDYPMQFKYVGTKSHVLSLNVFRHTEHKRERTHSGTVREKLFGDSGKSTLRMLMVFARRLRKFCETRTH